MKIISRLAIAVGFVLGGLLAGPVTAASASTTPVVYAAHLDPWHGYVRPGRLIFGNGGAPEVSNLTWKSWGSGSAWGTGRLWTQKPGCAPSYKCRFYPRWVGISLSTVRMHGSARYYARMAVEFFVSGKARWVVGWYPHYNCSGCAAYWGFPLVWPYF